MENKRLKGWAASSASPEEVSNRIKGVLLAGSGAIVWFLVTVFNLEITVDNFVTLVPLIGTLGGSIWAVWGALMALLRKVATIR